MDESLRKTLLVELFKHPYAPEHESMIRSDKDPPIATHVEYVYKKLAQIEKREDAYTCTKDIRLVEQMGKSLHESKRARSFRDVTLVVGTAAMALTMSSSKPMQDLATKLGQMMQNSSAASIGEAETDRIIKFVEDARAALLDLQESLA